MATSKKAKVDLAEDDELSMHLTTDTDNVGGEVEVEIVQKEESNITRTRLVGRLDSYLKDGSPLKSLEMKDFSGTDLEDDVESVKVCLDNLDNLGDRDLKYFIYKLNREESEVEDISETNGEEIAAASSTTLPSAELQGLWDSLIYETKVKEDLLRYIQTSLFLAEKKVNPLLVGVNRVVLLHGPPGTGKTSLCRALAQKLTIRVTQSNRFDDGVLMEINSHSLFSKWFSESGKLVQKMFDEIKRKVSNPRTFVCVLIDEVESLTSARKNSMSGLECSDAVRVVNALLTEIDKIKQHPNVLILTTSNITGSIDLAFVDRADIKQYVGPPTQAAIYQIYLSAIQELIDKGVLAPSNLKTYTSLKRVNMTTNTRAKSSSLTQSLTLWRLAQLSSGFSGRTLRKIPFHALALFSKLERGLNIDLFLDNLGIAVDNQTKERKELNNSLNTA